MGRIETMADDEPKFALGLQSNSTVVCDDKSCSLEAAWKQALATTQGVQIWGVLQSLERH